jgi:hypothetical protein
MINFIDLKGLALSFPATSEEPHFEKPFFKVNKRIIIVYNHATDIATIKLSEQEQDLFSLADKINIFPVPNKWVKQGWTLLKISNIRSELFKDTLMTAYCNVVPAKISIALLKDQNLLN